MTTNRTIPLMQQVRRAVLLHDGAGPTDGQLLGCFIDLRDEAAFAALVKRHGPMVWGVCRRLLNHHDAEDAFQATFLVLVRKATSVLPREMLANWLYGVAYRTAAQARRTAVRKQARERQVVPMPESAAAVPDLWHELQPLLDEELTRLPDHYRVVLVLCDLEGKRRKEAARQLGVPEGTVAGRLARARALLARRLARRGVVLATGTLAALLAEHAASAGVAASVVTSTIKAASLFAAGQTAGVIPAKVAALTTGVLKAMLLRKINVALTLLLGLTLLTAGAGTLLCWTQADEAPPPRPTERPARARATPTPVLVSEESIIARIAYSADGATVATLGITYELIDGKDGGKTEVHNCTVKLRDARTGALKRLAVDEKQTTIWCLTFSPDRRTVAFAAARPDQPGNWEVRLIDAETWQRKRTVRTGGSIAALAFSPDGKTLAFGGGNDSSTQTGSFIKLWDVQGDRLRGVVEERKPADKAAIRQGEAREDHVTYLAFSPDGKLLAAGELNGTIRLLDGQTGELKQVLEAHREGITEVAFSPDSRTLASGSYDKTVKLWDVRTAKVRHTLKGIKGCVMAIALSADGRYLATAEQSEKGNRVVLWDAHTGEWKRSLAEPTLPMVALSFSPDSKTLAIGGGDRKPQGSTKTVGELTLLPLQGLDAKRTDGPAKAERRDPTPTGQDVERKPDRVLKLHGPITSAIWSPDGKVCATVASRSEKRPGRTDDAVDFYTTVRIQDANTGEEKLSLGELKNGGQVHRLFAPDGRILAISIRRSIGEGDRVELWDIETGQLTRTLEMAYGRAPPRLAFSPDSRLLAVADGSGLGDTGCGARVFDIHTGKLVHAVSGHRHLVTSVAWAPDGTLLATGGDQNDREIRLWDQNGKHVQILEGLRGAALTIVFSPDGKMLAASDTRGGVHLWNVETGKEQPAFQENPEHASVVAFSRDGRLLLSAGRGEPDGKETGQVRVWKVKTGELLLKLDNTSQSAAFGPDEETLSVLVPGEGLRLVRLAPLLKETK
jgi:RNA polymerase sigma factor (sigma-70 family)